MEGSLLLWISTALPFLGALVSYGIGKKSKRARDYFADGIVILEFLIFLALFLGFKKTGPQDFLWKNFCGMGMRLTLDGFRGLYTLIASFMWVITTVFSREYLSGYRNRNRYYLFVLFTLGATIGVFLSADLYTTFLFFEIMSFTSYAWVAHEETKEALRAAGTYLGIAIIGGLVMLMGLFLLYDGLGTLRMDELYAAVQAKAPAPGKLYAAGLCLLFGFGAKAGAFPLHIWLPKAHPAAPAPASALLSGILTKAGVFGILVISCQIFLYDGIWGSILLIIGIITMFLGALLALFSNNIKRTLACSSLSQIGFILTGVGMIGLLGGENGPAVRGSLLHMINHSLIKLTLFLAAGVIYRNIRRLDLNEIRGFGRNKPLFHLIFLAGALSISGVPLFGGYVSKTLLHESIVKYRELLAEGALRPVFLQAGQMAAVEWIFLISGGLTAAYMAKLYVCIFLEKNTDAQTQESFDALKTGYMNPVSAAALACSAAVTACLGFAPGRIMDRLADLGQDFLAFHEKAEKIAYFSAGNLKGAGISLIIGGLVYFLIVRRYMMKKTEKGAVYCNRFPEKLDLENLVYRPILLTIFPFIGGVVCRAGDCLIDEVVVFLRKTLFKDSPLTYELPEGNPVTHTLGGILDHIAYRIKQLINLGKKEKPGYKKWFEHKLAMINESVFEYSGIVTRSMSFGLFLFCVGFLMTVLYLLSYYYKQ